MARKEDGERFRGHCVGDPKFRLRRLSFRGMDEPRGLKEFLDEQKRKGDPVEEEIARALSQLQARGVKDWEFIYEAIKRTERREKP